jgi:selenocysteine lyase/cysteine desulfurase
MSGTQNHEGLAGVVAVVEYLAALAEHDAKVHVAMSAIKEYETQLASRLLTGLAERPQFKVLGIADPRRVAERVPTVSITHAKHTPQQLAEHLAARHIYAWHGNMYALELSERLGLEPQGFLRLGLVHYNTADEVDATLAALDEIR